jgi:hypothetical protein
VKEDLIIPHVRRPDLFLVSANLCTSLCLCGRVPISFFDSFISVIYLFPCILQQHSFYDLIVNKARGKSGPVCFFYLEFVVYFISEVVHLKFSENNTFTCIIFLLNENIYNSLTT